MCIKREHKDYLCDIVVIDGNHFLQMPDGQVVPGLVLSRITDEVNMPVYAICKFIVNIK